jgi:hypothetical protein
LAQGVYVGQMRTSVLTLALWYIGISQTSH